MIFGATGNLMYKKLIPALNQLIKNHYIDETLKIFAIARTNQTTKDYFEQAKKEVKENIDWLVLEKYVEYLSFDVNTDNDYRQLEERMRSENYQDISIYLAVPPQLFPVISKGISKAALIEKGQSNRRIVFEKPFGEDLESAKEVNQTLWQYFDENQIYRIDHYLGKEMIQNILIVRFANIVFENIWDNRSIKSITILSKETEGIMSRGGYYDQIGALKDMLQSHLLQMAALVLMEKPVRKDSECIKDEKVKVLRKLNFDQNSVFKGQYKGYKDLEKVKPNSQTETFIYVKAMIDDPKWEGVPIHFLTGKKLDEKRSEIIIHFKDNQPLFPQSIKVENKLVIKVSPEEGVEFKFGIKQPGLTEAIQPAILNYCHNCMAIGNTPEAYEKLLLELLNSQRTLFTRWDEIETTWDKIKGLNQKNQLFIYQDYHEIKNELNRLGVDHYDL